MLRDLILKNRSYRRFYEEIEISKEELLALIDLARLSPSARNAQSFKYYISNSKTFNEKIFPTLTWAGYLKDWPGPEKGERPSAYIVILNDKSISTNYFCDHGVASQSILLGAVEMGLGGCILGSVNKEKIKNNLQINEDLDVVHVIALGKPKETIVIDEMIDGDYKYWRDENQVHHVPKRSINDIIL